jgi:hypothetical protein
VSLDVCVMDCLGSQVLPFIKSIENALHNVEKLKMPKLWPLD